VTRFNAILQGDSALFFGSYIHSEMKRLGFLALLVLLTGCVTGAHLVTGKAQVPVAVEAVQIYQTAPTNSELIGTVIAQALGDDQCAMDRGVARLKREAAKIGANGLVINLPVQTPGRFLSSPTTQLSAQALHVP
jgi:hypothetical protein